MSAIGIFGLLMPGYVIARAPRTPFVGVTDFPLSALAIVKTVISLSL